MIFSEINTEYSDCIKQEWGDQIERLGDRLNVSYYNMLIEHLDKHSKLPAKADERLYVVADNNNVLAFLSIVHAMPKSKDSWLKVLDVNICPSLDAGNDTPEKASLLLQVVTFAVLNSLKLTFQHHSTSIIKFYIKSNVVLNFCDILAEKLQQEIEELTVNKYSNWIEFELKAGE